MSRKQRRRASAYRTPDARTRAAKAEGFVARSVYKLEEIDRRLRLLKQGQHVLDLGAAPGSWAQYTLSRIGKTGRLLAIDLRPVEVTLPEPHCFVVGSALELPVTQLAMFAPYQVVLSDMAPNTTGDRLTDQIRSNELFLRALELSDQMLEPGGSFLAKVFMSGEFADVREQVRKRFATVRTLRPETVRRSSYEVFVAGMDRREAPLP